MANQNQTLNADLKLITALTFTIDARGNITDSFLDPVNLGSMASARLQLLPAIKAARKVNLKTRIFSLHSDYPQHFNELEASNICLIGKMSANSPDLVNKMIIANLAATTRLKNLGAKIVVQYCDNVLYMNDNISLFYNDILSLSDYIVYPTKKLQTTTRSHVKASTKEFIIPDPWQLKNEHKPRPIVENESLRLIWFGSNKNIDYLLNIMPKILQTSEQNKKYELTILAHSFAIERTKSYLQTIKIAIPNWTIRLVLWKNNDQPQQLECEITRAHIALIPSNPNDPRKSGVSQNRLVDVLRGGCIAVASPMESYKELSEISLQGQDFCELLKIAYGQYEALSMNLIVNRNKLLSPFSPELNKSNWEQFWKEVTS